MGLLSAALVMKGSNRRLEFKLFIGFVHPGGFMLGWFMGQMMEVGFRPFGCANSENILPPVPTIHHVVDRPRILRSPRAPHGCEHVMKGSNRTSCFSGVGAGQNPSMQI